MATLDDGVRNLERFIGLLTLATGELERISKDLASTEGDLSQLEDEAAEQGGGLNDRFEAFESALESAEDDAKDSLEDLRDAATAAQEAMGEWHERLEGAVNDLDERAQDVANDVDGAHNRLVEQGFESVECLLDEVQQEVLGAREKAAGLTGELVAAIEGFETEAEAAWTGADAALEQATADVETLESLLEASASEGTRGFESEAGELETACSSLESDMTAIYAAMGDSVDSEQQALVEAIQCKAQEAINHVDTVEQERVEQPAQAAEEEAFAPLGAEVAHLATVLAGAVPLTVALPPLTADLANCQTIVGQIDQLLKAVGPP